jgi:hypothetical protein
MTHVVRTVALAKRAIVRVRALRSGFEFDDEVGPVAYSVGAAGASGQAGTPANFMPAETAVVVNGTSSSLIQP